MRKKTMDLGYFQMLLEKYRQEKAPLQQRLIAAEEYWRLRHTHLLEKQQPGAIRPASGWLVNCILSKHADAVENFPQLACVPRSQAQEESVALVNRVLPAVLTRAGFDQVWSDVWWQKLKAGTGVYGVFWDPQGEEVALRRVDLKDLYWQPGVENLEDSEAVFCLADMDTQMLIRQYPQLKNFQGSRLWRQEPSQTPMGDDLSTVVDVYYKRFGKLHYLKYVGCHILFATEGNSLFPNGLYSHGKYPFVLDPLFPQEGYPGCGYGYVDLCRDAQNVVDILSSCFVKNALVCATPRWFVRTDGAVDEKEYADFTKPFVHVRGRMDEESIRPISQEGLPQVYVDLLQMKIDEIKEVAGNRDVNNGATNRNVTAAAAIAALQEAGNNLSKDMIAGSYRAVARVAELVLALLRQFYQQERSFRVLGEDGNGRYFRLSSQMLPQEGQVDISVEAQKENRYDRQEFNQLVLELFKLGAFRGENREESLRLVEALDIRGKERLRHFLKEADHGE